MCCCANLIDFMSCSLTIKKNLVVLVEGFLFKGNYVDTTLDGGLQVKTNRRKESGFMELLNTTLTAKLLKL